MHKEFRDQYDKYVYITKVNELNKPIWFGVLHEGVMPEVPTPLCKYYALNNRNLDIFKAHSFYIAHPSDFNDPYDCSKYLIDYSQLSKKDIWNHVREVYLLKDFELAYQENRNSLINLAREALWQFYFKHLGILSLSEKPDNYHLWSYYTGNTGFCVEIKTGFPENFMGPLKIGYQNTLQQIDVRIFSYPMNHVLCLTTLKDAFWAKEQEWRYLVYHKGQLETPPDRYGQISSHGLSRIVPYAEFNLTSPKVNFFPDDLNESQSDKNKLRKDLLDHLVAQNIKIFMMFESLGNAGRLTLERRLIIVEKQKAGFEIFIQGISQ
jgi:hypothetical protein